jgi:hypothetical protein
MTMKPRVWFNFLFPPIRPWERKAVEAWLNVVDQRTREIGLAQLDQVNIVQRLDRGRTVNFYSRPYGLFVGQFSPSFDIPEIERQVAEVRMSIDGVETKARMWVVNGHIFEIAFEGLPRGSKRGAEVAILAVKTGPFPANRKHDALRASLPPDFAEMEGVDDPVDDRIGVLTADQVYTVTSEGRTYWMLAEKTDIGMLGVPVEGDDRVVQFLFYDGRPPVRLSRSFKEAVAKARSIE